MNRCSVAVQTAQTKRLPFTCPRQRPKRADPDSHGSQRTGVPTGPTFSSTIHHPPSTNLLWPGASDADRGRGTIQLLEACGCASLPVADQVVILIEEEGDGGCLSGSGHECLSVIRGASGGAVRFRAMQRAARALNDLEIVPRVAAAGVDAT